MGVLRRLARADAFRSMGFNRQQATWHLQKLRDEALPLFDSAIQQEDRIAAPDSGSAGRSGISEPRADLPSVPPIESISDDYAASGLSLERHPLACLRAVLAGDGVRRAVELDDPAVTPDGVRISVAGVILVRQRPSTAGGIVFMTLEDETGTANLVFKPRVYRRHRRLARHEVGIVAAGRIERRGDVVHLVVGRVQRLPVLRTAPAEDESGVVNGMIRPRDFR